jgi:hypothetical protein
LPAVPTPTPTETVERIRSILIPLGLQQLDAINRDHGSANTDALAILALDAALALGVVTYGVSATYPHGWWVSLVAVGLSAVLALVARAPVRRHEKSGSRISWLRVGLLPDDGPSPLELLSRIERRSEPDAYALVLGSVLRAAQWSAESLRLKTWILRVALLLLPIGGLVCAVLFLVL